MPSVSDKQHRFMEAAAHNPAFAKRAGISVSTAKEFVAKDKAMPMSVTNKSKPMNLKAKGNPFAKAAAAAMTGPMHKAKKVAHKTTTKKQMKVDPYRGS